jgi:hypothetical protein
LIIPKHFGRDIVVQCSRQGVHKTLGARVLSFALFLLFAKGKRQPTMLVLSYDPYEFVREVL